MLNVLSTPEEQSQWLVNGMPRCNQAISTVLLIRFASRNLKRLWPIVFDPEQQVSSWLHHARICQKCSNQVLPTPLSPPLGDGTLQDSLAPSEVLPCACERPSSSLQPQIMALRATDERFLQSVADGLEAQNTVVVEGIEHALHRPQVRRLLKKQVVAVDGEEFLVVGERKVKYCKGISLLFLVSQPMDFLDFEPSRKASFGNGNLLHGCLIDTALTKHTVGSLFMDQFIHTFKPEFERAAREMEQDLATVKWKMSEAKVCEHKTLQYL